MADTTLVPVGGDALSCLESVDYSALKYRMDDSLYAVVQLVEGDEPAVAWPGSLVITAECSLNGTKFDAFPTAISGYTTFGMKQAICMVGIPWLQLRVSTPAGSIKVRPIVRRVPVAWTPGTTIAGL